MTVVNTTMAAGAPPAPKELYEVPSLRDVPSLYDDSSFKHAQLPELTTQTESLPAVSIDESRVSTAIDRRHRWERRFRWRLRSADAAVVAIACASAAVLAALLERGSTANVGTIVAVSAVTATTWMVMLGTFLTRDPSLLGSGATEYWRIVQATGMAFGLLAIVSLILEQSHVRDHLLVSMPLGVVALLAARWTLRRWLLRRRAEGEFSARAIVVGERDDVEYVISTLGRGELGYQVVGASLEDDTTDTLRIDNTTYPVVHSQSVAEAAGSLSADTIVVASRPSGDPDYIKRLAWQAEGTAAELVVSSRITNVAGPRMSLHPVEGLPLLHVTIPTFEGGAHVTKRILDILVSLTALIAFLPLGALIALGIKLDSHGPVFFRQARVGRDGREFRMLKFRSMSVDAEQQRDSLLDDSEGSGLLFKMRDDPRVTRVGRFLRKYSLDEVPQFINVLIGDMSVVGPRPPLPSEVDNYDGAVFRRLYIKPGITGPWQVGGRSDLSWDESVRLDLRYVENWSVISDLVLMWRTVKVMVRPVGAY